MEGISYLIEILEDIEDEIAIDLRKMKSVLIGMT